MTAKTLPCVVDTNPRQWPRTTDEAFRTPAWRRGWEGPCRRHRPRVGAWMAAACAACAVLLVWGALA